MDTNPIEKIRRPKLWPKVVVLMGAFLMGIVFALSPWGRHLERLCYDALFLLRGNRPPPDQVVVVAIDEASFGVLKEKWPWPRAWHARVIDTLFKEGAEGVAVDILFSEPGDPEDDVALATSVQEHSRTVLAAAIDVVDAQQYRQNALVSPPASLTANQANIGIINLPLDSDGFVRRGISVYGQMPAISFSAARLYAQDGESDQKIRDFPKEEILANYYGPPRTLRTVSYYQAMDTGRYLPKGFFRGKLVFIGLSLQAAPEAGRNATDHFSYPYSRQGSGAISGVEILATLGANLVNGNWIRVVPGHKIMTGIIWTMALSVLLFLSPGKAYPLVGLMTAIIVGLCYCLFAFGDRYFPPVIEIFPIIGGGLALMFFEPIRLRWERRTIRQMFSKYVSPQVVDRLMKNPGELQIGGQRVDATVMQLDIEGFSRMASSMSPEDLVALLSRTLGAFTETIFDFEGMVDKYVGDAIMAVWGVPIPQPDHARRACRAALEIRRNLKELQFREVALSGVSINIRIGISSGEMLAGNVGGKRFLNYTVHGEAANLAVRLEALNKEYGTRILIGDQTAARIGDEFLTREIGRIEITGQSSPVTIHELVGFAGKA